MSRVALVKCDNYNFDNVYDAVKKAAAAAGGLEFVKGKRVLLKPNLLAPNKPEDAVTTHPEFVKAVIRVFKEAGAAKIYVGDSPGIGTQEIIYSVTGIKKVVEEEGAEIADFKEKVEIENPNGKYVKRFTFAKAVADAEVIVSLPKLKTHGMTYYTGAVKNLFGCVPGLLKPRFHFQFPDKEMFSDMLVDLNIALKPMFAIMDGITAMEGNGPRNGKPVRLGVVLASKDLTALDATACRIVGIEPKEILPLLKAYERKIGTIEETEIEVIGEKIEDVKNTKFKKIHREKDITFTLPFGLDKALREMLVLKPKFYHEKCVMCRECIKVCPAEPKALEERSGKVIIDKKKCIRCFCCQEMCPVGAIKPKRFT